MHNVFGCRNDSTDDPEIIGCRRDHKPIIDFLSEREGLPTPKSSFSNTS
jgi:hypothetical protein